MDHLDEKFRILGESHSDQHQITATDTQQADKIYTRTCSVCHGADGKGTQLSKGFQPSPPNFTNFTVTPEYGYRILLTGYRGTMMQAYPEIPQGVKWGLINKINEMYQLKGEKQ